MLSVVHCDKTSMDRTTLAEWRLQVEYLVYKKDVKRFHRCKINVEVGKAKAMPLDFKSQATPMELLVWCSN